MLVLAFVYVVLCVTLLSFIRMLLSFTTGFDIKSIVFEGFVVTSLTLRPIHFCTLRLLSPDMVNGK
jgi:hypothetical protein